MMKKINNVLIGIIIIAVGVIFALNAFEITNIDIFFDGWWTIFIIAPCVSSLFTGADKIGSIIGILVGVMLLLAAQDYFSFDIIWKMIVPLLIIAVGLKFIMKSFTISKSATSKKQSTALFSGQGISYAGKSFEGESFTAIFGGIECDLTEADIKDGSVINAVAIFGGVDITLPKNVNVEVSSNSLFGGIDSKKHKGNTNNTITVYINGTCIFGGVEVK